MVKVQIILIASKSRWIGQPQQVAEAFLSVAHVVDRATQHANSQINGI